MLTLNPESACDVCAEEYGPMNLPRCIPCGHILCETCAMTIIEKTSPRLQPVCPYCRENFSADGIRVIRIDFSQSSGGGPTGPSEAIRHSCDSTVPLELDTDQIVFNGSRSSSSLVRPSRATSRERGGIFRTIDEDLTTDFTPFDPNKHRERGIELERLVLKVASKRCSVEELQGLKLDLKRWLDRAKSSSESDNQQHTALNISFLLISAILANHQMFSENLYVQEGAKAKLREQLLENKVAREKLESELLTQRNNVKSLRSELQKLKGNVTPTRRQSVSAAPSSMSAPTSPDGYFSYSTVGAHSMLTPNASSGSSSASSSGRTTPTAGLAYSSINFSGTSSASAAANRATSPSPAPRYHQRTTSLVQRSTTPAILQHTPSAAPSIVSRRAMTPGPGHHRSNSVAPSATSIPPVPQLPRSMTPSLHSHSSRSHASSGHPNGHSAGANAGPGAGGSSIPPIPVPVSQLSHSMNSIGSNSGKSMRDSDSMSTSPGGHPRPPVPPKPRTLSQTTGSQIAASTRSGRGVIDDRDGYVSEVSERKEKEKEKRKSSRHERWLPSALVDRISRPQTSLN